MRKLAGAALATLAWVLAQTACGANAADTAAVARLRANPDRLIVVTVADSIRSMQGRAGSTPRGYDAIQGYTGTSTARALAKSIANDFHLTQVAAWPIALLKVHCVVFEIPENSTRDAVLAALQLEPRVQLAQPLSTFTTRSQSYNDPYISLQTGFRQLDAADAHGVSHGEGVRVAIIDTGIDVDHPELAHRVLAARNYVDGDAAQFRRDRHGTQVAGVIAARANNGLGIAGIAPEVRLIALKACWQLTSNSDAANCNSFTLAKALTAALDYKPQIVNLSLGGPMDPLLAQLVQAGLQRGVIFVGAAAESAGGFPDAVPGVLAVAASEGPSTAGHVLQAPGREILTLLPEGHYDFASGASLAVAHVTGAVALILARHPRIDARALYDLLERTSAPLLADGAARSINACAALASIASPEPIASVAGQGCLSRAHTARSSSLPQL